MSQGIKRLFVVAALAVSAVTVAVTASAQGRCMTSFGSPECNTTRMPPVFAPTGWRTVALDQNHVRGRGLQEGGGVLHRDHGMDAAPRRWPAGRPGSRRVGHRRLQTGASEVRRREWAARRERSSRHLVSRSSRGMRGVWKRNFGSAGSPPSPTTAPMDSKASTSRIPTAWICRLATATDTRAIARRPRARSCPSRCC